MFLNYFMIIHLFNFFLLCLLLSDILNISLCRLSCVEIDASLDENKCILKARPDRIIYPKIWNNLRQEPEIGRQFAQSIIVKCATNIENILN